MKRRFTILTAALALLVSLAIPMGVRGQTRTETTTTYTFSSKAWYASPANWTSGKDGNQFTSGRGVQVTTGSSGANATSPASFENVSQIVVTYSTNASNGAGSIAFQIGSNSSVSKNVTKTGGTTDRTLTYDFSPNQSGSVKLTVTCTTNSIYVKSVAIKTITSTPTMSVSPSSIDFGSNAINPTTPYEESFEVSFANLTQDLSVSVGSGLTGVSVNPTTISKTASSPATVTVSYNPTAEGTLNGNITVSNTDDNLSETVAVTGSAYDPATAPRYELYTGTITEGDYVIYYNGKAMKNTVSSQNRLDYTSVTPSGNNIFNPDASIVWHIAPDGNYWTIYNSTVSEYAASTGSKNQATLVSSVTDNARWTVTGTQTYDFENLARSTGSDSDNKWLRNNGTYGFACYASGTGGELSLYKLAVANQVATPTFSVATGTYQETQSVELDCATDGATIYYTTDGTTPSASNGTEYTTAISVSSTMIIKAIAVKDGMTDSNVATAEYTIEQPYSTIPALFAAATATEQDVRVTFDNWVVSGVSTNGKSVYVTDNTGNGFVIYFTSDMSGTFAAGNILSGTAVACKLKLYNGAAELVNLTATDLTITSGGTVSIFNIPMSDLSGVNTGALVSYDNLTCSMNGNNYILSDGTTSLQAYNTLYAFNEFEADKTYNVTGVYVQYNSIKEIAPRSAADIQEVQVQHNEYTLTVSSLSHVELYVFGEDEYNPLINGTTGSAQVYDGTSVLISVSVEEGYVLQSLIVDGTDVTSLIDAEDDSYTFTMPAHNFVVTATAVEDVPPTTGDYVRITSLDQLTDGSFVVIASRYDTEHTNEYYAMKTTLASGKATGVSVTSTTSGSNEFLAASNVDNNTYWVVNVTSNGYTFTNANNETISWGSSTNFNYTSSNTEWTIERNTAGSTTMVPGYTGFTIVNFNEGGRAFAMNESHNFGPYSTSNYTGNDAYKYNFYLDIFVQTSAPITETYHKTITAYYDTDGHTIKGGYYLIASPIGDVDPDDVTNMLTPKVNDKNTYDLYAFDPTEVLEWRNYRSNDGGGFNLESGKGYLYGNSSGTELVFTGTAYPVDEDIEVTLTKAEAEPGDGHDFPDWNLVGNPFPVTAYITKPYYKMNENGTEIIGITGNSVEAMEGIFVIASTDGETMTFSTTAPAKRGSNLTLNLTDGGSLIDRAIVVFSESEQLPKFQLNRNSTKLYIPQDGKDYAVVCSEEMGAMPVNFKAEDNGTYTLNFSCTNVGFAYLHLIDNKTGNDVDLLQTPSYSFEAKTTDYESRFKLVFATGDNSNDDTFAFYSNGSFVINNEGNAELQVIDIMGRIVKSETINGCTNVNVNAAPGVYMLRLVNGDNVKVQKVVVK